MSPFALLFFGGEFSVSADAGENKIVMDDWIVFSSSKHVAHLVKELRMELDKLLQRRIVCPGSVESAHDTSLRSAIIDLVTTDVQQSRALTSSTRGGNRL